MVLGTNVGNGGVTCITCEDELTYLVVLDSISNEETERITDEFRELIPNVNYLWWENQKIGIIFLTEQFPDYDELAVCEVNNIHCQYLSMTGKTFLTPTPPSLGTASRVNVTTTDENNILVATSEPIFRGKFRQLYTAD
ncbi:hypothetical protein [Bacteroides acidifaciens]|uniref:hypothetical protein n=1 Tax=Bacteroides acidifaciens TaxID=85831 RepID=UPI0026F0ECB8|nr:hypothetical protein [Bacteroides acidifaciens]